VMQRVFIPYKNARTETAFCVVSRGRREPCRESGVGVTGRRGGKGLITPEQDTESGARRK